MTDDDVRHVLSSLPAPTMPQPVREDILRALRAEPRTLPGRISQRHQRRLRLATGVAAAAAVAALLSLGSTSPQPVTAKQPLLRAGALYEPSGFGQALRSRWQSVRLHSRPTGSFADSPQRVTACTRSVSALGRVIAIDTGTYDGRAAVVLITRYPAHHDVEEVLVVTPECGIEQPRVIRHILLDVEGDAASLE